MKLAILITFFFTVAVASSSKDDPTDVLTFDDERPRVVRGYADPDVALQLYHDLLDVGFPREHDEGINPNLVAVKGDAGQSLSSQLPMHQAMDHVREQGSKSSVIFRIEHLKDHAYDRSNDLVKTVAPNNVLDDSGTIHLYVSSPGAAALANHTDVTDIFVLHLDGAKEWMLCEEFEEDEEDDLTHKLNTCSTYKTHEIDTLECKKVVLHPGDALFLPRRVVHSARAVATKDNTPSAHLTFGFPNADEETCLSYEHNPFVTKRRLCQKGTCTCNCGLAICNSCCEGSSCDKGCNTSCDKNFWTQSCDNSCDGGCDTCS